PVMNTIMGWVLLGERLSRMELIGIALALIGVGLVVTEARNGNNNPDDKVDEQKRRKQFATGLLFAFGGALGQATGLLFSRFGVAGDFSALSGNLIRLLVGAAVIWTWAAIRGEAVRGVVELRKQPKALLTLTLGAIFGPFLGVWLSLIAVQKAPLGIASTLMSLSPVLLLPAGYVVFKERFGVQAIIGTIVAVGGTALLFLQLI
ncbi:MAG: EamA family transporter, partial [Anaerolineae bacterium]|nr:EamA family transporter [Anaerolineae bacterium]